MEDDPGVVSDSQFEAMAAHPEYKRDATGKLLTRSDTGEIFIRHRDWEKMQPPFGAEALAARERIEKARSSRYFEIDTVEPLLLVHEYALLRNATSDELETYVAAEEAMRVCQLKQREILKAAGLRGKLWENEESAEAYLHARLDNSSYEFHQNWPDRDSLKEALEDFELSWLDTLYEQFMGARMTQYDVSHIASSRYIDSRPDKYPNG